MAVLSPELKVPPGIMAELKADFDRAQPFMREGDYRMAYFNTKPIPEGGTLRFDHSFGEVGQSVDDYVSNSLPIVQPRLRQDLEGLEARLVPASELGIGYVAIYEDGRVKIGQPSDISRLAVLVTFGTAAGQDLSKYCIKAG